MQSVTQDLQHSFKAEKEHWASEKQALEGEIAKLQSTINAQQTQPLHLQMTPSQTVNTRQGGHTTQEGPTPQTQDPVGESPQDNPPMSPDIISPTPDATPDATPT